MNTKKTRVEHDVLADGDYPARITRFVGLGIQDQPEFNGQVKSPAFKSGFEFELIGVDTSGRIIKNAGTENETIEEFDPKPACMFQDYFLFPGAERGKVFDLCKAIDPSIKKVPSDLQWFIDNLLNKVVSVRVGHYVIKNGDNAGKKRNKVVGVSAIPAVFAGQVGEARRELIGFDPYTENDEMFTAYSKLYPYQRTVLTEAHDSANIKYAGKEAAKANHEGQEAKSEETQGDGEEKPF